MCCNMLMRSVNALEDLIGKSGFHKSHHKGASYLCTAAGETVKTISEHGGIDQIVPDGIFGILRETIGMDGFEDQVQLVPFEDTVHSGDSQHGAVECHALVFRQSPEIGQRADMGLF